MKIYNYIKIYIYIYLLLMNNTSSRRIVQHNNKMNGSSFLEMENPILVAMDIITAGSDGKKEENFGGGNLGAYYNFMYPDNSDYPWACVCNMEDFKLWEKKEQPYVRCRNQEDLSLQDIQANCDPRNVANYQDISFPSLFL